MFWPTSPADDNPRALPRGRGVPMGQGTSLAGRPHERKFAAGALFGSPVSSISSRMAPRLRIGPSMARNLLPGAFRVYRTIFPFREVSLTTTKVQYEGYPKGV